MHHVHSISPFNCLILSCYFGQDHVHMAEFFCEGFNEKCVNIYSDHVVKVLGSYFFNRCHVFFHLIFNNIEVL